MIQVGRLFMLLFLTNTRLWLANFCKILELEKARRNVSTSIIDDDLKLLSGKSDFDFEALSSKYYYFLPICAAQFIYYVLFFMPYALCMQKERLQIQWIIC